jgi:uncharacterized membrane protein
MQGLPWLLVRLLHVLTGVVWAGAAILIAVVSDGASRNQRRYRLRLIRGDLPNIALKGRPRI